MPEHPITDPILNCVLEVCCDAEGAQAALTTFMTSHGGVDRETAVSAAACVCEHFDLAEKGTLAPLKASIARLARGPRGRS